MSIRLDALRRQHSDIEAGIDAIEAKAIAEGRDLDDAEKTDSDALYARAKALQPDIEAEAAKVESLQASAKVLARVLPEAGAAGLRKRSTPAAAGASGGAAPEVMNVGEFMSLCVRSQKGDDAATELLKRAVDTQTTTETPGIIPVPIVGPVTKFADSARPVWSSFTSRPMPSAGKKFNRPRVTQRVLVAEQMAELAELASRNMAITSDEVTKRTFGGVLELSEQDIDWTDPAAMQLAIEDFTDYYAEVTELAACTALVALATTDSDWDPTDPGTIIASVMAGIGAGYATSKKIPDTLWLSLDEALTLAGTTNSTTDTSALALLNQALREAGLSMTTVVGPQLPADTRILGVKKLVESYENVKGLVTAPDVSHLGVFMAYRGYAATYGRAEGFVNLTPAP